MTRLLDRDLPALALAAVRRPFRVATIFPTSRPLAERLVDAVDFGARPRIVELGPGSGAITRVLLEHLADPATYLGVEIDPTLVDHLRTRFPVARFVEGSALALDAVLPPGSADHVVSSLPWSVFGRGDQERGVEGVYAALRPGGTFLTYVCLNALGYPSTHTFLSLLRARFARVERRALEWRNLPPAYVFRCVVAHAVDKPGPAP